MTERRFRYLRTDFPPLPTTLTHADVALAAQRLARIEHVTALDDQIELVVRPHGGMRRAARTPDAASTHAHSCSARDESHSSALNGRIAKVAQNPNRSSVRIM